MSDSREPEKAYLFENDMVIVFDQYGDQIPDRQGHISEVDDEIHELLDDHLWTPTLDLINDHS